MSALLDAALRLGVALRQKSNRGLGVIRWSFYENGKGIVLVWKCGVRSDWAAFSLFVLPLSVMSEVIGIGPCGQFGLSGGFCFMDAWCGSDWALRRRQGQSGIHPLLLSALWIRFAETEP